MDGTRRGDALVPSEPPDKDLADLARAPVWLVALRLDDLTLDLPGKLVGVAHRPARPIGERDRPILPIALEQLVAGLSRNAERSADVGHRLTIEQSRDEAEAFVHDGPFLPRHQHPPQKAKSVTHVSGTTCHLCLGTDTDCERDRVEF